MKLRNLKGKSASDLKIEEDNFESLDSVHQKDEHDKNDESNATEFQETTIQEYSIIEKCIKQYEAFFQIYFSRQILHIHSNSTAKLPSCSVTINLINNSSQNGSITSNEDIIEDNCPSRIEQIDKMFDTLKVNDLSRTTMLHNLLHKTMTKPATASSDTSDYDYKECMSDSDKYGSAESVHSRKVIDEYTEASIKQLMSLRLGQSLRCAVKLASSLLMEMSTFPSYNQNLVLDDSGKLLVGLRFGVEQKIFRNVNNFTVLLPPVWLKVLVLIACYCKSDRELQLATISTLFELISLLKSQLDHSYVNPGVTYVVMIPLLKFGHINYLELKTRIVQVSRKFFVE